MTETDARTATKAEPGDVWDFVITFGLLGPPSGTLIVFLALLAVTAGGDGSLIRPSDIGSGSAVIFVLGFLFGLAPAALTGWAAYAMRKSPSFVGWALKTALVGGALSAGLAVGWASAGQGFALSPAARVWTASFAAIGAAASLPPILFLKRRYLAGRRAAKPVRS